MVVSGPKPPSTAATAQFGGNRFGCSMSTQDCEEVVRSIPFVDGEPNFELPLHMKPHYLDQELFPKVIQIARLYGNCVFSYIKRRINKH